MIAAKLVGESTTPTSAAPIVTKFVLHWFALSLICFTVCEAKADENVDYLSSIKPLLAEKCYACHGALKQESDLRLETRSLMEGGGVLVAGRPTESALLERVTAKDDRRMPPHGEGAALKPDEIELVRRWIEQGALAPAEPTPKSPREHWAFQPIRRPDLGDQTDRNPIDVLLERARRGSGVTAVAPAPRTLALRRLYLDLIGLPPTGEQLADERAWEAIAEDLLQSPAHAERWARHWMDVWRYSDWYGLGNQLRVSQKHLWHWRDWIIASIDEDKGYDRMILEMIAGDELAPNDRDVVAATGFLARNYFLFNRTTWLDNTIEHTGKAFLGLTLNCAKCHDHKYDPVSQRDYYRFRALFEPHQVRLDLLPGQLDFEQDGLPRAFDDHIDAPTFLHIRGDAKNADKSNVIAPGVPAILEDFAVPIEPVALPHEAFAPGTRQYVQQMRVDEATEALRLAEKELQDAQRAMKEKPKSEPSVAVEPFELTDNFDEPNPEVWNVSGEGWKYHDGTLRQTMPTRERYMVRCLKPVPRDFEMICRYTTTGGTKYKSVTFRFDQSEDGKHANYVYSSAFEQDSKVHAAYTRDGKDHYPGAGRSPQKIEIGRAYELRFAVRDTLVNVWLDGQFLKAYRFPGPRRDGTFGFSAFDATAAFDSITIRSLSTEVQLTETDEPTPPDAEHALAIAESKRQLALARVDSVQKTVIADRARYSGADDASMLANEAARAQAFLLKVSATHDQLSGDEKAKNAAAKRLETAEKKLAKADSGSTEYRPLRGSRKALETPAHTEADYPNAFSPTSTGRRLALARWMTSDENPLTARVAVNHVWMRHFGKPLVESVFDFGLRAKPPQHQEILDLLADELMKNNWSLRHLHRLIVTSSAYRLGSSTLNASVSHRLDPENEFYWRAERRRMESQVVRDSLLHLAGELDPKVGGPSIKVEAGGNRRSLYFLHSRDQQNRFLTMFDDADLMQCYRRTESIVPQQALALSNSKLALEMSAKIAKRYSIESPETFVQAAFGSLLARPADAEELNACLKYFDGNFNRERRRAQFVLALLNHNDFVTIR